MAYAADGRFKFPPLLERLREELRREDADIRSILSEVVEVLIRKETGEEVYDPFAGQSLHSVERT
ncbi:hypothetical protein D3C72_530570 [compost metagenome]|jgi:hypothetical protein